MHTHSSTTHIDVTPKARHPVIPIPHTPATAAKQVYVNLANTLNNLAGNYDVLHRQTMQVALPGTELGSAQEVKGFCERMREQDLRHKEGMDEIQNIIDQILCNEGEEIRRQVNQELADQIDILVREQVAHCLKDHIPKDLQLELAENKREYEELQRALHNSESRRLNGALRTNNPDAALHTIYMPNGSVSPFFPKDLKGLFSLDAGTVKALMVDYGLASTSDIRDANLNKFMQFCGVRYQLVKSDNHKSNTTHEA